MKFLFFTGSRGEWGYIRPLLDLIKKNKKHSYNICATNMHLLDSFGKSKKEITKDGFKISDSIYMTLDGYNHTTTTKSMGVLIQSFSDIVDRLKPDWVIIAGDRNESLAACLVSSYSYIPTAHIQAGELSGNIDGLARHAIGKFAHIHFSSNKDSTKRLIKLGEQRFRIKQVGAPQLDDIKNKRFKNKMEVFKKFNLKSGEEYVLVIFHPVTEELKNIDLQVLELINSLNKIPEKKIWILPNSDSGSSIIKDIIFRKITNSIHTYDNVSREYFLGLMNNCKFLIGNSSSGILEAPSFKIPVINIGSRQNGRLQSLNILNVKIVTEKNITTKIKQAISIKFLKKIQKTINLYGNGNSSKKIIETIESTKINDYLLTKKLTY